ncbi:hypothetical protein OLMES_4862 [Oleiphilus messinensis]|uniref:Uncharacterized protein n=1 Tax=Oleiphilus messinensis TaxID=141451 RepID=A0A1Y0IF17_9GAMM|nr:hypothetical protein OLMES_4862 [Oleiphilus messinensis]
MSNLCRGSLAPFFSRPIFLNIQSLLRDKSQATISILTYSYGILMILTPEFTLSDKAK